MEIRLRIPVPLPHIGSINSYGVASFALATPTTTRTP